MVMLADAQRRRAAASGPESSSLDSTLGAVDAPLPRLAKVGAKVYVTAQEGDVTVTTDGKTYQVRSERPWEAPRAGDDKKKAAD